MTCDQVRDLIDDLAAGRLTGPRRDTALAHASGCAECAADLRAARALAGPLAALPASIAPPRDLWPGIAARTGRAHGNRAPASGRHRPLLAIAAALGLVAGSSAITMVVMRGSGPTPPVVADAVPVPRFEARYVAEAQELGQLLERQRELLAPETVAALERNLAIIDSAIAESRAALAADPSNRDLETLLRAGYEQKVALLERATRLARES